MNTLVEFRFSRFKSFLIGLRYQVRFGCIQGLLGSIHFCFGCSNFCLGCISTLIKGSLCLRFGFIYLGLSSVFSFVVSIDRLWGHTRCCSWSIQVVLRNRQGLFFLFGCGWRQVSLGLVKSFFGFGYLSNSILNSLFAGVLVVDNDLCFLSCSFSFCLGFVVSCDRVWCLTTCIWSSLNTLVEFRFSRFKSFLIGCHLIGYRNILCRTICISDGNCNRMISNRSWVLSPIF